VRCGGALVGAPSSHDGPPEVINLLYNMSDVPEDKLRLSVDDTCMSLAALMADMVAFCADRYQSSTTRAS